jgi:hypothetical protein
MDETRRLAGDLVDLSYRDLSTDIIAKAKGLLLDQLGIQLGIVPQDSFLFSGTVADNIQYGRLGAGQAEIEEAARLANAHDFIVDLPEGYATPVFQSGVNLSQGQRQLICLARAILAAKKRGAKMIVVDPVQTQSARMADLWLPLRPGTDSALLLGMIRVIVDEGLYNRDFVEKWCFGFDRLVERLKEYPLSKVSAITGLPADLIQRAARMYATNGPACAIEGMGLNDYLHRIRN